MNSDKKIKLFLVDDDALYLKSLEIEFQEHANFELYTFSSGEMCLKSIHHKPHLVILDYYLNGIDKNAMNGLDTLDKIKAFDESIAVIMLSSQDSIDVAIKCMHHMALDYVVKSETAFIRLLKIIKAQLKVQKLETQLTWYMERM